MSTQIALDLSRLVYAGFCTAPTGIPRVEMAYAEHFIATAPERTIFVVANGLGRLVELDRAQALRFIVRLKRFWQRELGTRGARPRLFLMTVGLHAKLLAKRSGALRRKLAGHAGPSVYALVSQLHLDRQGVVEGLLQAGDVRLLCFIHDTLPSEFPEWFPRGVPARKHRLMQKVAMLADTVLVNSNSTRRAFLHHFVDGPSRLPVIAAPLGAGGEAPARCGREGPTELRPYFVILGTIEPRKNHKLLLNIWRELAAQHSPAPPRLIVIGARGWKNAEIIAMLEEAGRGGFVEERAAVPDESVIELLCGARALLLPSFAEGYGLPLAEALALGVPVICSDIPVFREVGGAAPLFVDRQDAAAWRAAILAYASEPSEAREAQIARIAQWHAPSWAAHFAILDAVIDDLVAAPQACSNAAPAIAAPNARAGFPGGSATAATIDR
ncbi:MAG TPA: glycosyltransferase family 1 protein [Stellaceae bacterium]|jgi:glycosyltransferase involved in cell wall biosynthesis|nr:glycosyltransferase family 1 protein [Stellaceae bacterium]